MNQNKAK